MPPSPTSPVFPGTPPSRDTPNVHPYAIKTSSSAVLTRSNSTGHRFNANHLYTPPSPTKNPIGAKQSRYVPSRKHAKSLSSAVGDSNMSPPPVPMPPSSSLPARLANQGYANSSQTHVSDGEGTPLSPPLTLRVKRSGTLPSVFPSRSDSEKGVQDLPNNPKLWTPTQLSVYLSSSLRLKGGAKLPVPVARDIGLFVMKEHLSGRAFLRMKKEDYDALGINQLWKDALLDASRALRQNLVQGRIMGFGSGSPLSAEEMEEEDAMSPDLPAYSPLDPSHRRVPSSTPPQWEEDKKRMSKTSFRAGRVRGMVETYERSCSESSASGSECDERDENSVQFSELDARRLVSEPDEDEGGFASAEETSASEDEGNMSMASATADHGFTDDGLNPTCVKAHAGNPSNLPVEESSPSIEMLLREQEESGLQGSQYRSWGAKAWEDEVNDPMGVHATARRVPLDIQTTTQGEIFAGPSSVDKVTPAVPVVDSPPKGLVHLFSELTIQEAPPPKITKDVCVGVEDKAKDAARIPGPAVYEALEAFQERLEIVEKRLDEMERRDEERDRLLAEARRQVEQRHEEKALVERGEAYVRSSFHFPRPLDVLYPAEPEPEREVHEEGEQSQVKNYAAEDPSITGLPRYMFLVSLGVVAITTRVVLGRIIGGKRKA